VANGETVSFHFKDADSAGEFKTDEAGEVALGSKCGAEFLVLA
jgi:hypothetical protein